MATAFSYSGTGLESAIVTGSGGLSSTATSVEVDAIPSDLSAGDTVKIALGTATNFANGNGEVAHGDVGTIGGGANGGTNITGLSRGQEGTTASSFSEGDPVRVGVQGRNDVVDKRILESEVIGASPRVLKATDFSLPDGLVDGINTTDFGAFNDPNDNFEIENNALKSNTGFPSGEVSFSEPPTTIPYFLITRFFLPGDAQLELYLRFEDSSNWLRIKVGFNSSKLSISENVSGTTTTLNDVSTGDRRQGDSLHSLFVQARSSKIHARMDGSDMIEASPDASVMPPNDLRIGANQGLIVFENIIVTTPNSL